MKMLYFRLLIFTCFAGSALVVSSLAGVSSSDLIPRPFTLTPSSDEPSPPSSSITINLPRVVTSVDDGDDFYYLQANVAVEIDHEGTAAMIRARHEIIDLHLLELLRTYRMQELRVADQPASLREDIKREISALLPKGLVHNVYITNWLLIPAGSLASIERTGGNLMSILATTCNCSASPSRACGRWCSGLARENWPAQ